MGNKIAVPKVPQLRKKREAEATPAEGSDDPEYWRQEARQHAERRNELFERSQAAYRNNKGGEAKTLSDQGKQEERLMQEANKKASEAAFKRNNAAVEADQVDLHGLYVREAEAVMEKEIARARREKRDHLVAIVGQGHHSQDHVQHLRPAIQALAKRHGLECHEDHPRTGCLWIDITRRTMLQKMFGWCSNTFVLA